MWRREAQAKESGHPPRAKKFKEMDYTLEPPAVLIPADTLI
jgi:hypothetical protein